MSNCEIIKSLLFVVWLASEVIRNPLVTLWENLTEKSTKPNWNVLKRKKKDKNSLLTLVAFIFPSFPPHKRTRERKVLIDFASFFCRNTQHSRESDFFRVRCVRREECSSRGIFVFNVDVALTTFGWLYASLPDFFDTNTIAAEHLRISLRNDRCRLQCVCVARQFAVEEKRRKLWKKYFLKKKVNARMFDRGKWRCLVSVCLSFARKEFDNFFPLPSSSFPLIPQFIVDSDDTVTAWKFVFVSYPPRSSSSSPWVDAIDDCNKDRPHSNGFNVFIPWKCEWGLRGGRRLKSSSYHVRHKLEWSKNSKRKWMKAAK